MVAAAPAHAATEQPAAGSFTITNINSLRNVDVTGTSLASGAGVIQLKASSSAAQSWTLAQQSPGVFTIANVNSGLCLGPGSEPAAGVPLVQQRCVNTTTQFWKITPSGSGYSLENVASGLFADVGKGNAANGGGLTADVGRGNAASGAALILLPATRSTSQTWSFAASSIARVATWGTALAGGGRTFTNQTIRQTLVPSTTGNGGRITLSNKYGSTALAISAATIAQQGTGAATTGTPVAVTFDGSTTVSIPAGAELTSDPFELAMNPGQRLLVSLAVSGTTPSSSYHNRALETNFVASGNVAGNTDGSGFSPVSQSFFLKGIDTITTTQKSAIVALGDSITDGYGSVTGGENRWPNLLSNRLLTEPGAPALGVVNAGIASNRVLTGANTNGEAATVRFAQDVLAHRTVKGVFLFEGINDIGDGASAQAIIGGYKKIITQARAAGLRVYMGTITPWKGVASYTVAKEAVRTAVNTWIRAGGEPGFTVDYVADFDAALRDSADPLKLNIAYDSGDHIHPNAAGYAAIAHAVDLSQLQP